MKTLHTRTLFTLILTALLAVPAFAAGRISEIKPVLIPEGLNARDAKAAMVQTIAKKTIEPRQGDPKNAWAGIVDSLLTARVWGYQSQFNERTKGALRDWYIESVEKDSVVFGCKVRSHYMSVRMEISDKQITPQILTSENLSQKGDKIHENALKWIANLSTEVRKVLGQFSALKAELEEIAQSSTQPSESAGAK